MYHASMRVLARSDRNTVKAVAYRAGTDIYDAKTGQWFYFSDKNVLHVELLLPQDAPAWSQKLQKEIEADRQKGIQKFSDLMERAEKRKDSQVYREFEFALPSELTNEQNIKLAREFLQDQAAGRGVMTLASFHFDRGGENGKSRPHCHALLVTRRLEENGFSAKERHWNKKEFLLELREQLSAYTNFHLKLHGHERRVDHRSYAEQGIDIAPQPKLARNVHEMEARTEAFQQIQLDRRVHFETERQRNVARLLHNPHTVFDIVTRQQATFMWGDVEKVLARYVKEEDLFDSLNEKLKSSRELVLLREEKRITAEGIQENASIYTTQSMIRQELSLVHLAEKMGACQSHGTHEDDVKAAIDAANEVFSKQGRRLSQDQMDALHHITKADQLSCIVGYAGAGKSTTFKAAKEVWESSGYEVYGLAPTGRAAQNLEEIGLPSQTLHKFLKDYENGRSRYHQNSVLVLDEAGMVDVGRFNDLLKAVDHLGIKLVISGDGAQSQPIEAGAGLRLVTDRLDVRKIETIVRQKSPWQKEATRLFGTYRTREALEMYLEKGHVQFVDEKVPHLDTLVSHNHPEEVVELYNLSRRVCGNLWQSITQDLKEQKITAEDFFKKAAAHQDFALFQEWQGVRNKTAEHLSHHMETYGQMMKEKGVDPVAFANLFVGKERTQADLKSDVRNLIKSWGLESPHPLTPPHQCDLRRETRQTMMQEWAKSLKDHPEQSHLIVTYTNRDTHLLNEEARHLMRKQGVMGVEEHFHITKRESRDDFGKPVVHEERKAFSKGERLVFTRNDRHLKVRNGTLGTIEEMDGQNLKVRIDGDHRVISFASKLYPYFDRGWAITIIKSQGSTADRVFKLATFEEDRNLAYVAMTRHRESLCVFGSKLDFWREEIFGDRLSQNREKMSSLDYLSQEEAQRRLNPPARLMDALSFLGNKLEGLGYASRKSWESLCDRFLGKTPPENHIIFAQSSIEEAVRAMDMGINAAPASAQTEEFLSARQQDIFSGLKKSIMENTQFSEERKQKWIQFGLQDPEGTLQSWNGILIQQQIQEERRQERSQSLEHALEEIRNPKAFSDRDQRIVDYLEQAVKQSDCFQETKDWYLVQAQQNPEETLKDWQEFMRDHSFNPDLTDNLQDSLPLIEDAHNQDMQQELMTQAHSLMEKVREILPEDDFKKFEASLTEKPEAILDRCFDVIASHEEVLRLEADVSKFIELLDRSRDIIALTSGESKQIEPVLKEIFHQWKDDERFMEKLKESNNIKACQRVEYYQREQNRIRSQSYGYALEM